QEQEWGKPQVLFAFLTLIDAVPEVSKIFVRFLKEVDVARLTAPIVPLLGDKPWAADLLTRWKGADGTPKPVRNAISILTKEA
ncbi:MAG: ATPase, partial [Myxococcota bacterium]|nr:ATPase [Myxococcota bacterium]